MNEPPRTACRIVVRGVVQGVGFRPFVYRMAREHAIGGWVLNDSQGVSIHAEGNAGNIEAFVADLQQHPPAAARIHFFESTRVEPRQLAEFEIRSSESVAAPITMISPDLPICGDCRVELMNPTDPRYLYAYINCTACGPRYSIVRSLPYDRPNTTMAAWPLCDDCRAEYEDPRNRRHHAQPIACPRCGPDYALWANEVITHRGVQAIVEAASLLRSGMILALKGIGGYHLACAARNETAVRELRGRKFRKEKPFAIMVRNLPSAQALAQLDARHCGLLADTARPIVLAPARVHLPEVTRDTDELGLMLPYAPLHELLFHFGAPDPLVLTSANRSSEPIAYLDDDAFARLQGIADAFLVGGRPIARRVDDSVVAVRDGQTAMIRRARGYAPEVVAHLPSRRPILAVGADLKNAITLVVADQAIVGPHVGDLGDLSTDCAFEQTVADLLRMYDIRSSDLLVAHDLHPQYVSTCFALKLACHDRVAVQHHRAHVASVLAEVGELDRPVVGVTLDGTGYGDDGAIWGFEIFAGSVSEGFQRVAHLRPARLPGGDAAARHPVQAAAGYLAELELPDLRKPPFAFPQRFYDALQLVNKNVRCFPTTSAGRLFDTVAALCGFTRPISYEGQAAIWLEQQARAASSCPAYPFPEFDYRPLLQSVVGDRLAGRHVAEISYAFHAAIAYCLATAVQRVTRESAVSDVVFSGGVFQNRLLRTLLADAEPAAKMHGLRMHFNQSVPANDGGISLGQAAFAAVLNRQP